MNSQLSHSDSDDDEDEKRGNGIGTPSTPNAKNSSEYVDNRAVQSGTTQSPTFGEMSTVLEELRRVKEKLAEIDQQNRMQSDALVQANYMTSMFQEKELFDSLLLGQSRRDLDPDPALTEEYERLQRTSQQMYEVSLGINGSFAGLQNYFRLEKARLNNKYTSDSIALHRARRTIEQYHLDLLKKEEGDSRNIDDKVPVSKIVMEPILNYADWNTFKACGIAPEAATSIIDVLTGEPVLPDSFLGPILYGVRRKPLVGSGSKPEDTTVPGRSPLPERIRVHSTILLAILNKILDPKFSENDTSIVMVRPFKALSFYQNQLRDWYNRLDSKFSPRIDTTDITTRRTISSDTSGSVAHETETIEKDIKTDVQVTGTMEPNDYGPTEHNPIASHPSSTNGVQSKEDDETMSLAAFTHLRCLLQLMDTTIVEKQKYLRECCQRVSFVDLWHLFKPGVEVIEPGDKYMQCYKVLNVTSPRHKVRPRYFYPFLRNKGKVGTVFIHCVYIDFDGSLLGPVSKRFDIAQYEGLREITSLPIYPLSLDKNNSSIRQTLIERGNKFLRVLQVGHMHYNGLTLESRDEVDSQVVVDFAEALANREDMKNEGWKPEVKLRAELGKRSKDKNPSAKDEDSDDDNDDNDNAEGCTAECCQGDYVYDDNYVDQKQNEQFLSNLLADTDEEHPASLAVVARALQQGRAMVVIDDDKAIMSFRVFGFVLRTRSWAKLDLHKLMDLEEYRKKTPTEQKKENAFDNLVFPEDGLDRKTIVRSLVAQHFRDKESGSIRDEQSDIIRGKGKGLIILLHGAPGVGKTTTAEGIAELFNRPLFQITCGDLGTTAREVETALETNFALANKWGSILLLDEADVFLARRTPQDFKRNGLVAVFLRVLEYYAGILFLTTNRIGDFDEAFSSRIHISLHYPALDYNSTLEIFELNWRLIKARFAHRGKTLDIDTTKITGFIAEYWHSQQNARWNGRQIRNACHTALALAEFEAHGTNERDTGESDATVRLGVSHMKTVTDAYLEFTKYLQDVRDADQERYAYLMGIRRREGKGVAPEDPLATSFRSGHLSPLAEHKARFAAKYNRPEPGPYKQGYSTPYTPDRPGHRYGASLGAPSPLPYQPYSGQPQRGGPYQPPLEPLRQQGLNPSTMGSYYAGTQDAQHQQGPPPGQEPFPPHSQYGQHTQG
ncbi:hypothetical protein F4781DRAFT_415455 [Annulohypoxylon bovei var. microspora]|nr:hypothetical protein F4781DRAFT_415455 [Annulohypoxylon bovei var. microspora]